MEKKYRTKVKPDRKPIGYLAYINHWSVAGLVASLHYKQKELDTWVRLNKVYNK
tara:strand:- start:138 stop:299 length:162 start_codon:yes stop_codon:yes gene_type:complete